MKQIYTILVCIIVSLIVNANTKKPNFVLDRWQRFGVNQNMLNSSASANEIYAQKRQDAFTLISTGSMTSITWEIFSHNLIYTNDVTCATDLTYICAAIIAYDSNSPATTRALIDFDMGDYSIET